MQGMKTNYKVLGNYIRLVDKRNRDLAITNLLGVSIEKRFIPSIANIVGTDLSNYKVVQTGQFAYGPVTSRNGEKISIAYLEGDDCIISSSYTVFEVSNKEELDPEYLMLWFSRPEFDRYARYKSHGSVREIFDWNELCMVELPVPDIGEQRNIVKSYRAITDRIALKKQINDNLEATGLAVFKEISKEKPTESVLSDYCDFQEGYVNPPQEFPQYFDGKVKWLRGVDFSSQIIINTSRTLTDEGFNSAGKSALLFEPNTIVITKSGTIGKLGIIADYMCGNRATINIKPKRKDLLPFVYFFLKSIQPQFYDMAVGSAQVNLYVSVLQQIACPKYDGSFEKFTSQATILLDELLENSKEIIYLSELQGIILGELSR